jgi:TetR/AcrR family transcriptional regulator, tetracycline repressor protein
MPRQRRPARETTAATLWFNLPAAEENRRRQLTRERVAAEALALIGTDGVAALSMRALATRLGVVPGALYRHVRSKEQLYDLVLDGVLGEVNTRPDPALAWSEQIVNLAQRLRTVLEDHPGIAGLLKARDPISPHSLALAEAFLAPLDAAGLAERQTAQAFRLIYDYTLGFALGDRTSPAEQLIQDSAARDELHAFLRALPPDRFPVVAGLGEHIWTADRNEQFSAGLATIIAGLRAG